jgi:hypothetical protein
MYGMGGQITDPGEDTFSQEIAKLGVDIGKSPYQYYEAGQIAADFMAAPPNAIRLVWGSSLGANNCPVVAAYAPHVIIHGMWGFQASLYGAQVPIPSNCLFAHEVFNSIWIETMGLGAYKWTRARGNSHTNLYLSDRADFHPGETTASEAMFLAEMKRVMEAPAHG